MNRKTLGFTLVELSIVLVIIGVLIGLILSSSNLIKTSKYRNVISDFNYYTTSVKIFTNRYGYLPGDMKDTSIYWTGTSDGNGDSKIGIGDGSDIIGESTLAWEHLSLAGVINGSYTGDSAGTPKYAYNVNTPQTPIDLSFYSLYYFNYGSGIYGKSQNAISLASMNKTTYVPWENSIISPSDAYQIDLKADDGIPYTGQIYVTRGEDYSGVSGKCVSNDYTSSNASYTFTDTTNSCRIIYWLK